MSFVLVMLYSDSGMSYGFWVVLSAVLPLRCLPTWAVTQNLVLTYLIYVVGCRWHINAEMISSCTSWLPVSVVFDAILSLSDMLKIGMISFDEVRTLV